MAMTKRRLKYLVPVVISGLAQMLLGFVGLHRTISSYGRIDELHFCGYLLVSVVFLLIGASLLKQSPKVADALESSRNKNKEV